MVFDQKSCEKNPAYKSTSIGEHFHILAILHTTSLREHLPSMNATALHFLIWNDSYSIYII